MLQVGLIGSGLSGAILAGRLAGFAEVTVFERGGGQWRAPSDCAWTGRNPGPSATFVHGLGGTTNLWHGGLMPLAKRELGDRWPEPVRNDLARGVGEAVAELHGRAGLENFEAQQIAADHDAPEWADTLVKATSPFRATRSFLHPQVHLKLGRRVIAVEPRGHRAEVVWIENGAVLRALFDIVVVAAGAFGSAELLLRSGLGGDCAGRHLHDHPMGFVAKLRPNAVGHAMIRATQAPLRGRSEVAYKVADPHSGLVTAFYLRPAAPGPLRSDPCLDAATVFAPGRRLRLSRALPRLADADFRRIALSRTFGRETRPEVYYALAFTEQEALGQGRIDLRPVGFEIDWAISPAAVAALDRNLTRFAASLGAELQRPETGLEDRLWSGAHHAGSCRMCDDPRLGVVSSDLAVHGAPNIYVCDASVLPSTGATNTGLTIASLAMRLARHLGAEAGVRVASGSI